jgi:NifU-like protein
MWEYTDKVKDHFLNPRNAGAIANPDGIGEVGSLACGDALTLMFTVDDQGRIKDARFQTFGCASAIASSSALTEMIKGMTLEEAAKVTNEDIAQFLGGLPKEKMHCSVMGRDALEKAIAYYRGQPEKKVEGEIVCECFGVTDVEIERAVRENHLTTVEDVTGYTKAGGGCESCHEKIEAIIEKVHGNQQAMPPKPVRLSNIEKIRLIEETLEREIAPSLRKDGGDLELVDVEGDTVLVRLRGACASCAASQVTLKDYVESKLREMVTPELVVEEVR